MIFLLAHQALILIFLHFSPPSCKYSIKNVHISQHFHILPHSTATSDITQNNLIFYRLIT